MTIGPKPRILVVEDEESVRGLLVRGLRDAGYDVVALDNGLAALSAARNADKPFALVVTNNELPGLHGNHLIEELRQTLPDLPMVHIDDVSDPDLSSVRQDVAHLDTPFPMEALIARSGEQWPPAAPDLGSQHSGGKHEIRGTHCAAGGSGELCQESGV